MIGIKISTTLERTLYLDLPEDISQKQIEEEVKKEIIMPIDAMSIASQAIQSLHVQMPNLCLKDWEAVNTKFEVI